MKCPNCGKQIPDVSRVCGYCGTKLQTAPPPAPQPTHPAPEPESAPATPKGSAQPPERSILKKRFQLPGWAWGVIGSVLLLAVVLVLGLTRSLFIPYITPPPELVVQALSGARLTYHNDFSSLPESFFEYDDHNVILTNGVAEISGNDYDYPYIMYAPTNNLREGDAVLVTFRYDTGSWLSLSFLSGEYATPQHRQWGVNEGLEVYIVRQEEWSAGDQLQGNLNLQPNKWYTLLMAISDGPQFLAHIWERDNPGQSAQFRQSFSGDKWEDRGWVFWIASTKGKLYIDEISKITFNGLK